MTLTGVLQAISRDSVDYMEKSPEATMCEVVSTAISQADREGRLTHGLSECVRALSRNPSDVVICILPVETTSTDVNLNIQMLLIESVCVECDILILKLDINQINSGLEATVGSQDTGKSPAFPLNVKVSSELDCFLIQHGEEGLSHSDKKLLHTFQDIWNDSVDMRDFEEFPK